MRSVALTPVRASRAPQRDQGFSRASCSSPRRVVCARRVRRAPDRARVRRSRRGSPVDFRAAERARHVGAPRVRTGHRPVCGRRSDRGVLSFGSFSLHEQRKGTCRGSATHKLLFIIAEGDSTENLLKCRRASLSLSTPYINYVCGAKPPAITTSPQTARLN